MLLLLYCCYFAIAPLFIFAPLACVCLCLSHEHFFLLSMHGIYWLRLKVEFTCFLLLLLLSFSVYTTISISAPVNETYIHYEFSNNQNQYTYIYLFVISKAGNSLACTFANTFAEKKYEQNKRKTGRKKHEVYIRIGGAIGIDRISFGRKFTWNWNWIIFLLLLFATYKVIWLIMET